MSAANNHYQNFRLKAWIMHTDGTINQSTGVFSWSRENQRLGKIRTYINSVLSNYKLAPIKEVRFYDKLNDNAWVGTYKDGYYQDH